MTIKEIEDVFRRGDVTEDFLNTCKCDARKTVQTILRRYERTQQERARLYAMYAYERCAAERGHCIVAGVDEAGRGGTASSPVWMRLGVDLWQVPSQQRR